MNLKGLKGLKGGGRKKEQQSPADIANKSSPAPGLEDRAMFLPEKSSERGMVGPDKA